MIGSLKLDNSLQYFYKSFHQFRHQITVIFCFARQNIIIEVLLPVNICNSLLQVFNRLKKSFFFILQNDFPTGSVGAVWRRKEWTF